MYGYVVTRTATWNEVTNLSLPGMGAAMNRATVLGRFIVAGTAGVGLGYEPVYVDGRLTTHPDALRVRIGSCR